MGNFAAREATRATVEELLAEARAQIDRRFGLDSCDVIDGVQGWMAAGLPLEPRRPPIEPAWVNCLSMRL